MSKFSLFMKANKEKKPNEKYAPTRSLKDEHGEPLKWEFRRITSKENEELRDSCTYDVQITGKPNQYRPRVNTRKYIAKMITAATVYPDLRDAELQDSYGVVTPEELLYAMVDDAGEYTNFTAWMQKFQGFSEGLADKIGRAHV